MYPVLITVHVLISLALMIVVLLQSSKGGGLAGAFGGGTMGAVFGGRGAATFLSKLTTVLAIAFFISCLGHSMLASRRYSSDQNSVLRREAERQTQQQMETPVPLVPSPATEPTTGTEGSSSPAPVSPEPSGGQ